MPWKPRDPESYFKVRTVWPSIIYKVGRCRKEKRTPLEKLRKKRKREKKE